MTLHHDRGYFEGRYSTEDDPWGFDRRWYEQRKYDVTLAALPRRRYAAAFEPGCANGALTERLADRCDRLTATDLIERVAARAAGRLAGAPHVDVRAAPFPQWWPSGRLDLLVLSEVAYYLTPKGWDRVETALGSRLVDGAHVVAVHYTGSTDYPMHGSDVAPRLDRHADLERIVTHQDQSFELGVWERVARPSSG